MRAACVCEGGGLRAALREDLDRYVFRAQKNSPGPLELLRVMLLSQGLWAIAAYRLNNYVRDRLHSRLLAALPLVFQYIVLALTGIEIDAHAHIGPGFSIPHGGYIVIGPVRMGRNCEIYQGVTLGVRGSTGQLRSGVPTLGDRVWVGPGAVIAGGVTVGDDASVGANSLLVRDVPPRGVVLGVPARLVSRLGSFAQIGYPDMDSDDERKAALANLEAGPDDTTAAVLSPWPRNENASASGCRPVVVSAAALTSQVSRRIWPAGPCPGLRAAAC
jgi:serine O-acetyltransferase